MTKLLKDIWLILTVDCEQSAALTSHSFDDQLKWSEKIAVWLHCLICNKSRRLHRQLITLNERMTVEDSTELPSRVSLSDEARLRIRRQLEKNSG